MSPALAGGFFTTSATVFLKKIKIEQHDPAISLLGIHPEKMKTLIQKDTCTPTFLAVLFAAAKTWKQAKCASTNDWLKKV